MSTINLLSSGLDVQTIVDQLIQVERAPIARMETQSGTLQSRIKALQSLNTKLSALLDKLNNALFKDETAPLNLPAGFERRFAKSIFAVRKAASSDESAVLASAAKGASVGSYAVTVSSLAKARTEASGNFADTDTTTVGTGTLVIQVGTKDAVTINVDETNNTLEGVRQAINNANAGVSATILNDGTSAPYRLLITAKATGTVNAFTVTDSLSGGQSLGLTETQAAVDAQFTVNGIRLTKSTNTVSDVISGITFTLKAITAAPVEVTVENDTDAAIAGVKELITAYNEVNSYANSQAKYDADKKQAGILAGDVTLRNTLQRIQESLTGQIANNFTGGLQYVGEVGLKVNSDGSLSLDEAKLKSALESDLTGVAGLFLGDGAAATAESISASDSRVTYSSRTPATQAGTYSIEITSLAQRASVAGGQAVDTLAQDESLTVTYGGVQATVDLLSGDSLQAALDKINAALAAAGMAATASDDGTGRIAVTTSGYGSSESIAVASTLDNAAGGTGFSTTPTIASGTDIAGTINGNAAVGSGLTLTGASGNPEEGLSLNVALSATGSYGTVTFAPATAAVDSDGILAKLRTVLKSVTDPLSGPIHRTTDGLNNSIKNLDKQISQYEDRLEVRRQQLLQEFYRADEALKMLTVTQSQLSSQLGTLTNLTQK
jgi:flagellar hook-associated protein 2